MPAHLPSVATDTLLAATAAVVVVACYRFRRLGLPPSVLTLAVVAAAVAIAPGVHRPSPASVDPVVTVALVTILFDGGMELGRDRFGPAAGPIVGLGLAGTAATAALAAVFCRYAIGLTWYPAVLVAVAVAPTDPAVVFSVVGRRRPEGRSGSIVEGESGANDPVGIALMAGFIGAGGLTAAGWQHAGTVFGLQLAIGAAIGGLAGWGLSSFGRRIVPEGPFGVLLTTVAILGLYALTAWAHGSGYLAVFVTGVLCGGPHNRVGPNTNDARPAGAGHRFPSPRNRRLHSGLAGVGEATAFAALGCTVDPAVVARLDVWLPGLALGAVLAVLIRPGVVGLLLGPGRLTRPERRFVQLAGLKGAVPILLGTRILATDLPDRQRVYGMVVVSVVFSVVVVGSLIGPAVGRLGLAPEADG